MAFITTVLTSFGIYRVNAGLTALSDAIPLFIVCGLGVFAIAVLLSIRKQSNSSIITVKKLIYTYNGHTFTKVFTNDEEGQEWLNNNAVQIDVISYDDYIPYTTKG